MDDAAAIPDESSRDPSVPGSPSYAARRAEADSARRLRHGLRSIPYESNNWERIVFGVAVAGLCYPGSAAVAWSPFLLIGLLTSFGSMGPEGFIEGTLLVVFGVAMASIAAFVVALLASLPVIGVVGAAMHLLSWRPAWRHVGAFCGALTAFLITAPLGWALCIELINRLTNPQPPRFGPAPLVIAGMLLTGPGLATVIGQVFGARAGLINDAFERFRESPEQAAAAGARPRRFRVSIRQLFVVTALTSVLLATLRATNLLTLPTLFLLTGWLAWQATTHRPAIWVGRWLLRSRGRIGPVGYRPATPTSPRLARPPHTGDAAADLEAYWRLHDKQMADYRRRSGQQPHNDPPSDRST